MPEPFACIVHSYEKLRELMQVTSLNGKQVAIIGAGNAGAAFGFFAKDDYASVTLFNKGQDRRSFLVDNQLFNSREVKPMDTKNTISCYDVVIVTPTRITQECLAYAFELVKDSGWIHLYGGTRKDDMFLDTKVNIDTIRRNERVESVRLNDKVVSLSGAYGCSKRDFEKAFDLYEKKHSNFPMEKLVSKHITFDSLPQTIMDMASNTVDFPGKVLISS